MTTTYKKGLWAEGVAAVYLMIKGYRIKAWRYKTAVGEIDLIARRGRVLVFVEVKARPDIATGVAAIRPASYARLQRAAEHYMARYHTQVQGFDTRFDLVVVAPPCRIKHLDNVILYGS